MYKLEYRKVIYGVTAMFIVVSVAIQLSRGWIYPLVSIARSSQANTFVNNMGIVGDYTGQATLQGIYNGTLDNTTAVSTTMDLGYIDLAFNLSQSGANLTGNVILSRTLVFSATEGNIAVTGSMNGANLHLQSGQFKMKMNDARVIGGEQIAPERMVTRQFRLDTEQVLNDGATLLGTYRETIWGYAPEPVTVVGKFALERPTFGTLAPGVLRPRAYLPVIQR